MVRTFLKVYMELGSYFLFLQEQIKDIIIIACAFFNPRGNVPNRYIAVGWLFFLQERVLFIGTQFSNLYTAVDTPAMGRVVVCLVFVCFGVCVQTCARTFSGLSASEPRAKCVVLTSSSPILGSSS